MYFETGKGASYLEPQFVAANAVSVEPKNTPTRQGYDFQYWSLTENGEKYTFGQPLSKDITLHAVWDARKDTKYTVIFWKQSVSDDQNASDNQKTYDYEESVTRTGTTGQAVSPNRNDRNKSYTGFSYNSSKSQSVTIAGDGTTILNVYYDRKKLTINFYKPGGWLVADELLFSYTGLYGQTLEQNGKSWPDGYTWKNKNNDNQLTFLDTFIFDGEIAQRYGSETEINLYRYNNKTGAVISHYKQNVDGTWPQDAANTTTTSGNARFTLTNKYSGFTVSGYSTDGGWNWYEGGTGTEVNYSNSLMVRYTRNSYNLTYYNYNTKERTLQLKYGESLSGYADYTPARPVGISKDHTFQGWYKDKECTVQFDFNTVMPANGIVVYAKWAEPQYTGTVHLTMNGDGGTVTMEIPYGSKISESDLPAVKDSDGKILVSGDSEKPSVTVPAGYEWAGWSTKEGDSYIRFNFDTKLYADLELYPYWISTASYTVTYDLNGGAGTAPVDSRKYAENSHADVLTSNGIKAPTGKTFLYWNLLADGSDEPVYPDTKLKITGNVTLFAIYGDAAKTTTLTYASNYPTGSGKDAKTFEVKINNDPNLPNNTAHTTLTAAEAGFEAPEDYYFDGWKDRSGNSYSIGQKIGVDTQDPVPNMLYAQWKKVSAVVITITGDQNSVPYDGTQKTLSSYKTTITIDGAAASVLPDGLKLDNSTITPAAGTDAGDYALDLQNKFNVTGNESGKYKVSITAINGKLTITKKPLVVKTADAEKEYDGTPLTKQTATLEGLVTGENATVIATGSQTEIGESDNTYKITWDSAKQTNYSLTEQLGKLKVTENSSTRIVFTAETKEKTYDGKPLTGEKVTAEGIPTGLTFTATARGSQTNADSSPNQVSGYQIKDAAGKDVTKYFTNISKVDGTLRVNKRTLIITTPSQDKTYDGQPLTAEGTCTGLAHGETVTFKTTGTQTEVGSSSNTYILNFDGTALQANYEINESLGTLTVKESDEEIVVTTTGGEYTYDGKLHGASVTVSTLPEGYTLQEASSDAEATDVTTAPVTATADKLVIVNAKGVNVTDKLQIKYVNGSIKVNPAELTVTTPDAEKEYDGTALTAEGTYSGLVNGETVTFRTTGSQTDVGSSTNGYTLTWEGIAKESNYKVTERLGELTVKKNISAQIVFKAESKDKTYDGEPLTCDKVTTEGIPTGLTSTASAAGSQTVVGSSDNTVSSYHIQNAEGKDVTKNFQNIETIPGKLTVNPAPLTVITGSAEKQYDGTALTSAEAELKGLVHGEKAKVTTKGSQIKVGSSPNTYEIVWESAKQSNYEITEELGTLEVTPFTGTITIKAADAEKVYDGDPLQKTDGATAAGLPDGLNVTAACEGSITDVGETDNVIESYKITDAAGTDVTGYFSNITTQKGRLKVTPAELEVITGSKSKAYDGIALTDETIEVKGLQKQETVTARTTGSQTEIGKSDNTYEIIWDHAKESNYTIKKTLGTLEVLRSDAGIVFTAQSAKKEYDGTPLTKADGVTATGLPDGFSYQASAVGSQTDVGSSDNVVNSYQIFNQDGADVTSNFAKITAVKGTLEVTKKPLIIKTMGAVKKYDGLPLTNDEAIIEGLVHEETAEVVTTGEQTKVGKSENTYRIDFGYTDRNNYEIKDELGILEVTKNDLPITVTALSSTKIYDGKPAEEKITVEGLLPSSLHYVEKHTGGVINVKDTREGNFKITTFQILDENDFDVTKNFSKINLVDGTLTITPRPVTLTSDSAKKEYDGKPLTANKVTVSGDGFAEGEYAEYDVTGSQTEVGQSDNTFTYKVIKSASQPAKASVVQKLLDFLLPKIDASAATSDDPADNYDITVVYGTLTVTQKSEPEPKPDQKPDQKPEGGGGSGSATGERAVAIYKVDEQTGAYLAGAQFALYDSTGKLIGTYETNEQGFLKASYLSNGSYYFVETKAPDGYAISQNRINFYLDQSRSYSNDYPWNIKVTNRRMQAVAAVQTPQAPAVTPAPAATVTNSKVPATGDESRMQFYGWLALFAAAAMSGWFVVDKKRRGRK